MGANLTWEILSYLDPSTQENAALVYKACGKNTIPKYLQPNPHHEFAIRMFFTRFPYYEVTLFREFDESFTLLQYKCACQLWDEDLARGHPYSYHFTACNDDEFEDFDPESERAIFTIDFSRIRVPIFLDLWETLRTSIFCEN